MTVVRFANGVRVVAIPRMGAFSATIAVGIRAGSRDETPAERGAAHLLEHLLMRGTVSAAGIEITRRIDGFGGSLEPFTMRDWTCVAIQVPAAHARAAAGTVMDLVAEPALTDESVEAERGVVLEEVRAIAGDPRRAAVDAVPAVMFSGHPLGASVAGTAADVSAIDTESIRAFHRRTYRNGRLVAVVGAGAVRPDWLAAVAQSRLGDLTNTPVAGDTSPTPQSGTTTCRLASDTAYVAVGTVGQPRTDPQLPAITVLNEILGGGLSSRWVHRIREEKGIAYDVASMHEPFGDAGVMTLFAGVPPQHLADAVAEANRLLDLLGRDGVTADEVTRARERALGQLCIELDDNYALTWRTLERVLFSDRADTAATHELDRLARVTHHDVNSLAEELASRARVTSLGEATR